MRTKQQKKIVFTEKQKEKLLEWSGYLETTELSQGQKSLRTQGEEYCCLGIYIKCVHPEKNWKLSVHYDPNYYIRTGNKWQDVLLPGKFQKELGLHRNIYGGSTLQDCFVDLNDQLNYNFLEIAREIRYLVEYGSFTAETMGKLNEVAMALHTNKTMICRS